MTELNPFDNAFEPVHLWLRTLPWWQAVGLFLAYVAFLFVLQWLIFRFFRVLSKKTSRKWPMLLADALQGPVIIFLLSGSIGLLPPVLKVPREFRVWFSYAAEFLAVVGGAIFFQKLFIEAYRRYAERDEAHRTYSNLIRTLITVLVYSVFLMIFLDAAGISITPLIASLGVGSVAVAFALQQTLASLFAGLFIVTDRPIRVGDYVKLETGEEGYVESIGWRSVRIRMLPNNIVIVPNSKLADGNVINYSLPSRETAFTVEIGIEYGSNLDLVEQVTLEIARAVQQEVPLAVPAYKPSVMWAKLGESSLRLNVILQARDYVSQAEVRSAFIKRLMKRYRHENIFVPFPVRSVLMRKVEQP
jgi:small-conductance mechanosensitive channel